MNWDEAGVIIMALLVVAWLMVNGYRIWRRGEIEGCRNIKMRMKGR